MKIDASSGEHRLTWVTNQFDAQGAVAKEKFDYVLLDLAIPARPGGEADQQFGINRLEYFQQYDGLPPQIPGVISMWSAMVAFMW